MGPLKNFGKGQSFKKNRKLGRFTQRPREKKAFEKDKGKEGHRTLITTSAEEN